MKIAKKMLAVLGCATLLLSGCTQSNIVAPTGEAAAPDFTIKEDVKIVWEQVHEDLGETFMESEEYPGLVQVGFNVNEEEKTVSIELLVSDDTDKEEAVEYATAFVKALNDQVRVQNSYFEESTEESYGGFFKQYGFQIVAAPASASGEEAMYLINDTVAPGEERDIKPAE